MWVSINQVYKGDTIIDGRNKIKVDRIEHEACSSKGTHVNRRICYERDSSVQIKRGGRKDDSEDFLESGLGDLQEDNLLSSLMRGLSNYILTSQTRQGEYK